MTRCPARDRPSRTGSRSGPARPRRGRRRRPPAGQPAPPSRSRPRLGLLRLLRPILQAVAAEGLGGVRDRRLAQQIGAADGQREVILLGDGLQLHRQPHRLGERGAGGDHAVVGQQAAGAPLQRHERVVRQLARAEGGVGRAADVHAAEGRDHVVAGGDRLTRDGQHRGEGGMDVHHRADLGPRALDERQWPEPGHRRQHLRPPWRPDADHALGHAL